jgi:hypothetical protein
MGCNNAWERFEPAVIKGWPIDLIKISGERFVYPPLDIEAKRMPMDDFKKVRNKDGVTAWREEAPFDMEW